MRQAILRRCRHLKGFGLKAVFAELCMRLEKAQVLQNASGRCAIAAEMEALAEAGLGGLMEMGIVLDAVEE